MCIGFHVKCPLFLSYSKKTWTVAKGFRKFLKYQISWRYVQSEPSCSTRTDRRSDVELLVAFRNALKIYTFCPQTSFMCLRKFLWTKTAIISLYGINMGLQTFYSLWTLQSQFFLFKVDTGLWADHSSQPASKLGMHGATPPIPHIPSLSQHE